MEAYPELIKLRLLVVISALVLACAPKFIAATNINRAATSSLVLGLYSDKASINFLLSVRVDPLDLRS